MIRLRQALVGLLFMIASLCVVSGCGPPEQPVEDAVTDRPAETGGEAVAERTGEADRRLATEAVRGKVPQPGEGDPIARSQTADEAVRAVLQGLREKDPRAVWEFLPDSYQRDVNGLVHEFGERMDPELWNGGFTALKKLVFLLKTQKRFILSNPKLKAAESIDIDALQANWDGLVGLLETLAESDISEADRLKTLDVGEVLESTGGRLMEQLAALSRLHPENPFQRDVVQQLGDVDVTLVSSDGETARVRLHVADSEEPPQEFEFIQVEGKWIPRTLAEQWETNIAGAKTRLEQLTPEKVSQLKGQMLPALEAVNATLGQLQTAKTQAEFDAVVQQQVYPLLERMAFSIQAPTAEPGTGEKASAHTDSKGGGANAAVTVTVMGRLDADTEETLSRLLRSQSDDPGNAILIGPEVTGDRMSYRLLPVGDIEAFLRNLDFAEVIEVDGENRNVTIKLRRPRKESEKEPDGGP